MDHLCFSCKFCKQVNTPPDQDIVLECTKSIVSFWSPGAYKNIFQCEGYEFDFYEDNYPEEIF